MDRFEAEVAEFVFDDDVDEANRWEGDYGLSDSDEPEERAFNPDQPRDDHGRWSSTGGGGSGGGDAAAGGGAESRFELGSYSAADLTPDVARARYDHIKERAQGYLNEAHEHISKAKKEPDEAKRQALFAKGRDLNAKFELALHDAMTYRQAEHAVDRAGYIAARQNQAAEFRDIHERKQALVERMVAAGVKPQPDKYDNGVVPDYRKEVSHSGVASCGDYGNTADQDFADAQAKYTTNLTREMFNESRSIRDAVIANQSTTTHAASYYGEPETPTMRPASLGTVDAGALPPSAVVGGGTGSDDVKAFMANSSVAIAIKDGPLAKMISSGEFKNRFEGGTGGAGKGNRKYAEARLKGERELFGIHEDAPASERPAYGFIEHNDRLTSTAADIGENYGRSHVVLKDEAKARTTFTVGDSLDDRRGYNSHASAVNDPILPAVIQDGDPSVVPGKIADDWRVNLAGGHVASPRYIEAQVFGKITLADIKEIRVPVGVNLKPAHEKKLAKAGVAVVRVPPVAKARFYNIPPHWESAFSEEG
jgi:hypothetical protein